MSRESPSTQSTLIRFETTLYGTTAPSVFANFPIHLAGQLYHLRDIHVAEMVSSLKHFILDPADYFFKEEASRKKYSQYMNYFSEGSFIGFAILSTYAAFTPRGYNASQGLLWLFAMVVWNLIGTLNALLNTKEFYQKATLSAINKKIKTLIATVNFCYFAWVLPIFTGIAYALCMSPTNFNTNLLGSSDDLGSPIAWALSNFAFGLGMLVNACTQFYSIHRSHKKSTPLNLLLDRFEKYSAIENNDNESRKKNYLKNETRCLLNSYLEVDPFLETIPDDVKSHACFNELRIALESASGEQKNVYAGITEFLLYKQFFTRRDNSVGILANILGAMGATFAGISMLTDRQTLTLLMMTLSGLLACGFIKIIHLLSLFYSAGQQHRSECLIRELRGINESPENYFSNNDIQRYALFSTPHVVSGGDSAVAATPGDSALSSPAL